MKKLTELLKTSMTWLTRVRKKAHSGHFWWFCTAKDTKDCGRLE